MIPRQAPGVVPGEGLTLRLPQHGDRDRWLELFCDPDQRRFGTPAPVRIPETLEDVDDRIGEARQRFATGQPCTFVIASPDEPRRFLGTVAWSFHVPSPLRVADIGYSVHPDARGAGVATRAVRAISQWLTSDATGPGLARVQLDHSVENPASCRTALAAGFEREGVRRSFLPLRDPAAPDGVRRHDVCLHGLVAPPPVAPATQR